MKSTQSQFGSAVRRLSSGRPLPADIRRDADERLGFEPDDVRVHADPLSDRLARRLDAVAFTTGRELFFRAGAYRPETSEGRRLIAHELIHVAQQASGDAPLVQRQESATPPVETLPAPETLDNLRLVEEVERSERWLATHSVALVDYARWESYLRRLNEERGRRILAGHVWMAEGRRPTAVYQLIASGQDQVVVARVEPGRLASLPPVFNGGALLSERQFAGMLAAQAIESQPVAAAEGLGLIGPSGETVAPGLVPAGVIGAAPSVTPWTRAALGATAQAFTGPQHLRTRLTGALGEASLATRTLASGYGLIPLVDLNAVSFGGQTGNFPIFDWRHPLTEQLYSVKASAQATQAGRVGYYLSGGGPDITLSGTPRRQVLFGQAAQTIYPTETPAGATALALERARLAVNPEDVAQTATDLGNLLRLDPGQFRAEIDSQLARKPGQLEPGGAQFNSLAAIEAELNARPTLRPGFQALVDQWADALRTKVTTHGTPAVELLRARQFRQQIGFAATETQIRSAISPELLQAELRGTTAIGGGGGVRGNVAALGQPAAFGAGIGGVLGVVYGTYVYIVDPQGTVLDVVEISSLSGVSGGVGGATQQLTTSALNRVLLSRLGGPAAIATGRAGGTALLSRGVGGGAAGAIAAPVFVVGHLTYEELTGQAQYEAHQYVSKGGRAAIVGGTSGFLATVGTAALVGTAAGPVGTVVGIIIGIGVYLVVDKLVGDEIEAGIESLVAPASVVE